MLAPPVKTILLLMVNDKNKPTNKKDRQID
jgi:hypothetical protein